MSNEPSGLRGIALSVWSAWCIRGAATLGIAMLSWLLIATAASGDTGYRWYVVQPGDTLYALALEHGVTSDEIAAVSGMLDSSWLVPGTPIRIPTSGGGTTTTLSGGAGAGVQLASGPASGASGTQTYTVQPGDTLTAIAWEYDVSIEQLAQANGIDDVDFVRDGMVLDIPSGGGPPSTGPSSSAGGSSSSSTVPVASTASTSMNGEHTVGPGDTLWGISRQYGVTESRLIAANDLSSGDHIIPGQRLLIPTVTVPSVPSDLAPLFSSAASAHGVDRDLLVALAYLESGWQMHVVSIAGAVGIMQIMPDTGSWALGHFGMNTTNWEESSADNIRLGTAYFAYLLDMAEGNESTALAAYYQGWTSLHRHGPFSDTRQYVADILALRDQFASAP